MVPAPDTKASSGSIPQSTPLILEWSVGTVLTVGQQVPSEIHADSFLWDYFPVGWISWLIGFLVGLGKFSIDWCFLYVFDLYSPSISFCLSATLELTLWSFHSCSYENHIVYMFAILAVLRLLFWIAWFHVVFPGAKPNVSTHHALLGCWYTLAT